MLKSTALYVILLSQVITYLLPATSAAECSLPAQCSKTLQCNTGGEAVITGIECAPDSFCYYCAPIEAKHWKLHSATESRIKLRFKQFRSLVDTLSLYNSYARTANNTIHSILTHFVIGGKVIAYTAGAEFTTPIAAGLGALQVGFYVNDYMKYKHLILDQNTLENEIKLQYAFTDEEMAELKQYLAEDNNRSFFTRRIQPFVYSTVGLFQLPGLKPKKFESFNVPARAGMIRLFRKAYPRRFLFSNLEEYQLQYPIYSQIAHCDEVIYSKERDLFVTDDKQIKVCELLRNYKHPGFDGRITRSSLLPVEVRNYIKALRIINANRIQPENSNKYLKILDPFDFIREIQTSLLEKNITQKCKETFLHARNDEVNYCLLNKSAIFEYECTQSHDRMQCCEDHFYNWYDKIDVKGSLVNLTMVHTKHHKERTIYEQFVRHVQSDYSVAENSSFFKNTFMPELRCDINLPSSSLIRYLSAIKPRKYKASSIVPETSDASIDEEIQ